MATPVLQPPRDKAAEEEQIYTEIHRVAWKRRTTGLMAGITLGVTFGLAIGAAVAFLPATLAALGVAGVPAALAGAPALGAIMASAGLFAGVGGMLGLAIGADVGSSAGAVTAGLTRTEPPGRTQAAANAPAPGLSEYVNPKVGIACAGLFAAFGVLLATTPFTSMAVMSIPLLKGLTGAAMYAASGTVMGLFGATMGLNFPLMSAKLSNAYTKLVTGKVFDNPSPTVSLEVSPGYERTANFASGHSAAQGPAPMAEIVHNQDTAFSPASMVAERAGKGVSPQAILAAREANAEAAGMQRV